MREPISDYIANFTLIDDLNRWRHNLMYSPYTMTSRGRNILSYSYALCSVKVKPSFKMREVPGSSPRGDIFKFVENTFYQVSNALSVIKLPRLPLKPLFDPF